MLGRLCSGFDRGVEALASALVVALLLCVAAGVVTRSAGNPLIWTDEVARFLMVWLACLGWMLACRRRIHVRIRFFQDLLPLRAWRAAEIAIQAALVLFGAIVAGYGVGLVLKNADLEATSVEISMAWMYVPLVPAGLLMALQALAEIVEHARSPA